MQRSYFKKFFETYFNYPYEKLKFREADCVRQEIATSYECQLDDVECFFLFSKLLHYLVKEQKHYGFYRIKGSDIYIPFYAHVSSTLITAHVELQFNYNINNSVFDCCHVPLKKEKTVDFYYLVMDNLQPAIKKILNESDLMVLTEKFKKSSIYFDFDIYYLTLDVAHRGYNFNESFKITTKLGNDSSYSFFHGQYYLQYCLDKKVEVLSLTSSNINPNNLLFSKDEMLRQSFNGINNFGCFEYTTINDLDLVVQQYRQVEKMYTI